MQDRTGLNLYKSEMSLAIDKAWEFYCEEENSKDARQDALNFLIYAFDIQSITNINQELLYRMLLKKSRVPRCDLYLISELPESPAQYKNSYIFIKKNTKRELYYIKPNGKYKKVKIADFNLFEEQINALKNNDETKFYLSEEQIKKIITSNGGHAPVTYPEYIPGLKLELNNLKIDALDEITRKNTKYAADRESLRKTHALLQVNPPSLLEDERYSPSMFKSAQDRSDYRVHIYQGKFYKQGELFDSSNYYAHHKNEFAAFTLNIWGELSVFTHTATGGELVHSSMNAQKAVVSAGEFCIKEGKLIAINTYSGHYQPSLFNLYRTLSYLASKGIDISQTKIYADYLANGLIEESSEKLVENLRNQLAKNNLSKESAQKLLDRLFEKFKENFQEDLARKLINDLVANLNRKLLKKTSETLVKNSSETLESLSDELAKNLSKELHTWKNKMTIATIPHRTPNKPPFNFYQIDASLFTKTLETELDKALKTIKKDLEDYQKTSILDIFYQLKDSLLSSNLTKDKKLVAHDMYYGITTFKVEANYTKNVEKIDALLKDLNEKMKANKGLFENNYIESRLGSTIQKLTTRLQAIKQINPLEKINEDKIALMKNSF